LRTCECCQECSNHQELIVSRSLWYPGPLGGAKEANAFSIAPDPLLNFPLGCCDKDGAPTLPDPGPCRGHIDLFEQEEPQVVWVAGQDAYFQLSDFAYSPDAPGSTHHGGSCQVGFSVDGGVTWKVAASFIGNCPHRGVNGSPVAQTFDFKIPQGIPTGDALFIWIWLNREHESYVNCAKIRIGSGQDKATSRPSRASSPTASLCHSSRASKSAQPKTKKPTKTQSSYKEPAKICEWESAPIMQTSYFTKDAKCMPGAKLSNPKSDNFEYGWDVSCGVVDGDNAYSIRMIEC
jgi:hypothetical protein